MGTTILGMGRYVPENKVYFESGTRLRVADKEETQLSMGVKAANEALRESGVALSDIAIVCFYRIRCSHYCKVS